VILIIGFVALQMLSMGTGLAVSAATSQDEEQARESTREKAIEITEEITEERTIEERVKETLSRLTLEEKAGQMVQGEVGTITPEDVMAYNVGSVFCGGGSRPPAGNSAAHWLEMYEDFQQAALQSSSRIPIIFGVDAVHGHNNVESATLFPHNIGLGAANDPELMYAIGEATAREVAATGLNWNFSPCVAVAQDIRWGRYYESFGESAALQESLVKRYVEGLQQNNISATAKHFVADGATGWNKRNYRASRELYNPDAFKIDQGNSKISEQELHEIHLVGYLEAIEAGVDTVMISHSSINGVRLHGHNLIQSLLKSELGFRGIVVSDYESIHQLPGDYRQQVIRAVNAGIDMLMEPRRWRYAINAIIDAVKTGEISQERVDDAVTRILTIKYRRGIMDEPIKARDVRSFYAEENRMIAREAVRKSLVLLKNEGDLLPVAKDANLLLIGPGSDNVGMQAGGWTLSWQGSTRGEIEGTSIRQGLEAVALASGGHVFTNLEDASRADVVIVVIGEIPYAEGVGDNGQLTLGSATAHKDNLQALKDAKSTGLPTLVILLSGRPLLVTDYMKDWDAFIAAFLPGSEGGSGIADVLYGDYDFSGKLPMTWPKTARQFGATIYKRNYRERDYLFPFGYGLDYGLPKNGGSDPLPKTGNELRLAN
jgi:beta-glucosidase